MRAAGPARVTRVRRAGPLPVVLAMLLSVLGVAAPAASTEPGPQPGDIVSNLGSVVIPPGVVVEGDVVAGMGSVTVAGTVRGNVTARVGSVTVTGTVGGDVVASLGSVVITGTVGRDVLAALGSVTVTGKVGRDLRVDRGRVRLGQTAVVGGRVQVEVGRVDREPGAVAGPIEVGQETDGSRRPDWGFLFDHRSWAAPAVFPFGQRPPNFGYFSPGYWVAGWGAFRLLNWLIFLIFGVLAHALFPRPLQAIAEAIEERPNRVFWFGLAVTVAAVPLVVLVALTIVGIPLALALGMALYLGRFAGQVAIAMIVGRRLAEAANLDLARDRGPVAELILGASLLALAGLVPGVATVVWLLVTIFGLGAVALTRFGTIRDWTLVMGGTPRGGQAGGRP